MYSDRMDGNTKLRYCATCDHWYVAGTFISHCKTSWHQAAVEQSRAMRNWYERNGS